MLQADALSQAPKVRVDSNNGDNNESSFHQLPRPLSPGGKVLHPLPQSTMVVKEEKMKKEVVLYRRRWT